MSYDWVTPLPVAIPMLTAAVIAGGDHVLPRRLEDALAIAAAAASAAFSLILLTLTQSHGYVLQWFGGWRPRGGVAIGVAFAADPFGAGMAALAAGLGVLALVFSWTYLKEAARLFDVLMLCFVAAMAGFALSGDLFNMFVWFELMAVAAYALVGFDIGEIGPLQGAVNFAITNTVGAYLVVVGIALLYARTGALNLAQIGHTLAGAKPDGLVVVALVAILVGFLVKAAIVPFHLWLADAYAVAPAPVCVLLAGAMCELGLFGVARAYWTIFAAPFGPHEHWIRAVLLWVGVVTCLLGALMCFLQRHLRRLLAFSTISYLGIILVGVALLDSKSLAGAADVVLAHGFLVGALFLGTGVLLSRLDGGDELDLHGAGRRLPLLGALWGLAALGLVGLPYAGAYLGHAQIDEGAAAHGIHWVQPLLMLAAGVTAGTILRAGARVFLGWGPAQDSLLTEEPQEKHVEQQTVLPLMLAVIAAMVALGLVVSVVPGLANRAERAADRFRQHTHYAAVVLHGKSVQREPRLPFDVATTTTASLTYGAGALALALLTAAFGLWRRRLPGVLRAGAARALGPPIAGLKAVHSGVIGDYVMWITVGTAVFGGIWTFTLR